MAVHSLWKTRTTWYYWKMSENPMKTSILGPLGSDPPSVAFLVERDDWDGNGNSGTIWHEIREIWHDFGHDPRGNRHLLGLKHID